MCNVAFNAAIVQLLLLKNAALNLLWLHWGWESHLFQFNIAIYEFLSVAQYSLNKPEAHRSSEGCLHNKIWILWVLITGMYITHTLVSCTRWVAFTFTINHQVCNYNNVKVQGLCLLTFNRKFRNKNFIMLTASSFTGGIKSSITLACTHKVFAETVQHALQGLKVILKE